MTSPSSSTSSTPYLGDYSGSGIIPCASVFIAVQTLVVGLRLFTKYLTKSVWGWDDYMLIPAFVFTIVLDVTFIYAIQYAGLGYHEIPLLLNEPNELILTVKLTLLTSACTALAMCFSRYCTFFIYLRIFTSRSLRIATWILLGVISVYATIAIILNFTVCIPISALWTLDSHAKCFDRSTWWNFGTLPVLVIDLITMALPVSTIMRLSVPLEERVALLLTFLAYSFGTVAEVVRTSIFIAKDATTDITWVNIPLAYATMCEVGSYLIAACMPGLRPLYLYVAGKGSYSRKIPRTSQNGVITVHQDNSHQLDSFRMVVPTNSVQDVSKSGQSNVSYHQPPSEESLVINQIQ